MGHSKLTLTSAGVKANPHALRHTFGTEFLNAGGLATDLQLLMGHEHIETTLIYSKVALDRIQERFAGLSLIERLTAEK
jgi:site-specific recombinase XerD